MATATNSFPTRLYVAARGLGGAPVWQARPVAVTDEDFYALGGRLLVGRYAYIDLLAIREAAQEEGISIYERQAEALWDCICAVDTPRPPEVLAGDVRTYAAALALIKVPYFANGFAHFGQEEIERPYSPTHWEYLKLSDAIYETWGAWARDCQDHAAIRLEYGPEDPKAEAAQIMRPRFPAICGGYEGDLAGGCRLCSLGRAYMTGYGQAVKTLAAKEESRIAGAFISGIAAATRGYHKS